MTSDGAIPPVGPLGIKVASMDFFSIRFPVRWKDRWTEPRLVGADGDERHSEFLADVIGVT
jgi:ATP-binding protein involved in chromosome partitioning